MEVGAEVATGAGGTVAPPAGHVAVGPPDAAVVEVVDVPPGRLVVVVVPTPEGVVVVVDVPEGPTAGKVVGALVAGPLGRRADVVVVAAAGWVLTVTAKLRALAEEPFRATSSNLARLAAVPRLGPKRIWAE